MTKYVHPLTAEEVEGLRQEHRKTRQASVRSRCEMILLSAEGIKGLFNKPVPGRPPRVTAAYLELLERTVERNPRELDLPFSNWTTAHLAEYMTQQTGIRIGARQMENYLKAHRWRLRRPVLSVKHKQDQAQVTEKKSDV